MNKIYWLEGLQFEWDPNKNKTNQHVLFRRVLPPPMKEGCMKMPNKDSKLRLRPREAEPISLDIPKDTLASMQNIATSRDMSLRGLLKFYIGQGLRQDLSRFYADQVLNTTAEVLARHLHDDDQISAIMEELQFGSLVQVS